MSALRAFLLRCAGFVFRTASSRAGGDLRDEFEFHVEQATNEHVRRGMSRDEARRLALVEAGGLTAAAESVRERRSLPWGEAVLSDVRHAVRGLRSSPAFACAALLTLALGIGVSTGMFAIVQAVVLRPLPYPAPDRIVALSVSNSEGDMHVVDDQDYFAWARGAKSLQAIAVYGGSAVVLDAGGGPQNVKARAVTSGYFDVMGMHPRMGREFTADELRRDGAPVVIISDQLWRTAFGADPTVIGKLTRVDGADAHVIGVMPPGFTPADGPQVFQPQAMPNSRPGMSFFFAVLARLAPGATPASARSELAAISHQVNQHREAEWAAVSPNVVTLHDSLYGSAKRPLVLLMAAVTVLLLIACANIANLAMARAVRRRREFALRRALGATAGRLTAYVLVESLVLSTAGAVLGTAMAAASIKWAVRISPATISRVEGIHVNGAVLAFAAAAAVFTAMAFGLVPAVASGRGDLSRSLSASGPRTASSSRERSARRFLVVAELATALVLLVGAALVARTFWRVSAIEPGFDPHGLQVAHVRLPFARYGKDNAAQVFYDELMLRVRSAPQVAQAVLVDVEPFNGASMSVPPRDSAGEHRPGTYFVGVGSDYFSTLHARILSGRGFTPRDAQGSQPVAVINEALARYMFPDGHAIGRTINFDFPARVIVGIAADVHQLAGLEKAPEPLVYTPLAQGSVGPWMTILFRARATPRAAQSAISAAVSAINPALAPPVYSDMDEQLEQQVAPRKFMFVLLATFAALAALLAVVGLYGVLSYLVAEQTREIGIRAALGADQSRLTRRVLGQGAVLVGSGIAIGIFIAMLGVKLISGLLYGVSAHDPASMAAVVTLLGVASLLACYVPAWRASHVDPIIALRVD